MSNLTVKYFKNLRQNVFLQTKLFTGEKMELTSKVQVEKIVFRRCVRCYAKKAKKLN